MDAGVRAGRPSGDAGYDTPVLLVHGFGHNRSGWLVLDRRLRRNGFTSVHSFNYNAFVGVPRLAELLAERVDLIRAVTGAERVNIVGHSLGGILLRWYVQELGGDETVGTAITVASPHEGAPVCRMAGGRTAQELRPGSWLLRRLDRTARPSAVQWVAYYSNLDLLVPPTSAMIRHPALAATNLLAKDLGHVAIMIAPRVTRSITEHLEGWEAAATQADADGAAADGATAVG